MKRGNSVKVEFWALSDRVEKWKAAAEVLGLELTEMLKMAADGVAKLTEAKRAKEGE